MRARIFVTEKLQEPAKKLLSDFDVFEQEAKDSDLATCEVLIAWPSRAGRDLLSKMKALKMLQSLSAGVDSIDFAALPDTVRVFSNAGAYSESVAEHAWGLALGIAKGLHAGRRRLAPRQLRSKTLLVLGCGSIGSEVARLARTSLAMKTIGVSRSFDLPELFDEKYPVSELTRVVGAADLIVNSLPLTKETRKLVDSGVLAKTRDNVIMVNVGRGDTMDEAATLRWLKERPDARLAVDVFWKSWAKRAADSPFWDLPNFAGTLHIAGVPEGDTLLRPQMQAAENVKRFLTAGQPVNEVNLEEYR